MGMGIISKISTWFFALLGFLGITSCNRAIPVVMYGVPYAEFEAKCTIVDSETNQSVRNVQAHPVEVHTHTNEKGETLEFVEMLPVESVYNPNGSFVFKGQKPVWGGDTTELQIKIMDPNLKSEGCYKDSVYVIKLVRKQEDPKSRKDKKSPIRWGMFEADVVIPIEKLEK